MLCIHLYFGWSEVSKTTSRLGLGAMLMMHNQNEAE